MQLRFTLLIIFFVTTLFGQNYHDTQGKLEITNSGQASYILPVALPPSLNEIGPTINLTYSSGSSTGIAGQGWSINSISSISRNATRIDIEGYRDGVDFDTDDKLVLDGQYLLLKSGTYWSPGSQYQTEIQGNTKIELIGSGSNMYFIVTAPDGSRSWYGNYNGENASDLTSWYINRYEDVNGNVITYHYISNLNSINISEIRFSMNINTNPTPLNKIVFTYKNAARQESYFIKGVEVKNDKILDRVEVYTNNLLFKKYQLTHSIDENGYQRVSQVQEFNSQNEGANPVLFEYNQTSYTANESLKIYTGSFNSNFNHILSGDFDGDGRLDFTNSSQIYFNILSSTNTNYVNDNVMNLPLTLTKDKSLTVNTLKDNKLTQSQSILNIVENDNSIALNTYSIEGNSFNLINFKNISINNLITNCEDNCTPELVDGNGNVIPNPDSKCATYIPTKKTKTKYLEGDFNGDSISELLVINFNEIKKWNNIDSDNGISDINLNPNDIGLGQFENENFIQCKSSVEIIGVNEIRLIDLNPNNPNNPNTIGNFSIQSSYLNFLYESKYFLGDFNADGKSDLIVIKNNGSYKIFTFKENLTLQTIELEIIGQGVIGDYNESKQIMFGDYNGDNKTDIMLPDATGNGCITCNLWHIYFSNPKNDQGELFTKISKNIVEYWQFSDKYWSTSFSYNQYFAIDINKDGKTDLMRLWLNLYQPSPFWDADDFDSEWRVEAYINNLGFTNQFNLQYSSYNHGNEDPGLPMPIVANFDFEGRGRTDKYNSDIAVLRWQGRLEYLDILKDYTQDNLLKKVIQSNNAIIDELEYANLNMPNSNGGLGFTNQVYSSSNEFNYPYIEFKQMPSFKVVKLLKNTSGGSVKFQKFKYHGLIFDLKGVGLIGFKKVVRSNWFLSDNDKKMWSETIIDPIKRGVVVSSTTFKPTTIDFGFNTSQFPPTSNFLNRKEFSYQQVSALGAYPSIILKSTEKSIDYISGVIIENNYNYSNDGFYLQTNDLQKRYLTTSSAIQSSVQTETIYESSTAGVGANYYIGRPKEITKTSKLFVNTIPNTADNSNTQVSNEKLYYANGNLIKTEKSSNNATEKLVEQFVYFTNGLVQQKTVSAIGTTSANAVTPLVTEYTYDATNRFVKTTKNVNDNLIVTNDSYHPIYGLVTAQTNALGQTTASVFDNWGKRTKVTDFLGKSITYAYSRVGTAYTTTETGDDGTVSSIEQDALARETRKGTIDLNGNWNYVKTEYDTFGRKYRVSEPYAANASPTQWNTTEFDELSRPVKVIAHTGKVVTTTFNGLTVTATEPYMSKSKTMNAAELVYSATDTPGGTITYKYDANGNLLESDYEGIKTTMEYDAWGRKKKLTDTSAGTYTYVYDAFGRVKEETTPKGKTVYTYDTGGRIATKVLSGLTSADATDMTATYTYHPTYKWLTNLNVVNPIDGNSSYVYSYDTATKQLNQTVEQLFTVGSTTPVATFTKAITFDTFGRVNTETSTAVSYGKTSTKTISHVYKNGVEWQLKDGTAVVWQANSVNSRGQLLNGQLGNGIAVNNTYDSFGYLIQQKHDIGTANVMTLSNQFEPVMGNLMTRTNSLFDTKERFEYDALDRLVKWDGAPSTVLNLPFNTTTDGFTFTSTAINGSVSNATGTLKVVLKKPTEPDFPVAAQRVLNLGMVANDKIRIKATITNKTSTGGALVKAIMVEEDPADPFSFVEYEIGTIENGLFDVAYTISDFISNPVLKLRFVVVDSGLYDGGTNTGISTDTGFGSFTTISAIFNVDNLIIDKIPVFTQDYDNKGRITQNALGAYKYEIANKPYQNSKLNLTPLGSAQYAPNQSQLDIAYNMFSSPYRIANISKNEIIDLSYSIAEQRSMMYWGNTNTNKNLRPFRRYYSADGSMEVTATFTNSNFTTPSSVEIITFVDGTAYDAAIVVKNTYTGTATTPTGGLFYLHRDYQGSIVAITNATGSLVEKRLFDPWGAIVKVQDGAGNTLTKLTFFDRGYTGHEHLERVGLINMNGRVYDPALHRFLQADSMVQEPYNTQNYNRYGYCLNNPLKYTDVSGEDFGATFLISIGVALVVYFGDAILSGKPITFKGIATTVVTTAVSAGISYGIGTIASGIGNFTTRATFQAVAHGVTQGGMTALQGGKFWSGFAAGSVSSVMSSLWRGGDSYKKVGDVWAPDFANDFKGIGGAWANSTTGTMFFGSISGGAAAALTGGNFWQGAVSGMIVSGMNSAGNSLLRTKGNDEYDAYIDKVDKERGSKVWNREIKEQDNEYNFFFKYRDQSLYESVKYFDNGGPNSKTIVLNAHGRSNYIVTPKGNMYAQQLHWFLLKYNHTYQNSYLKGLHITVRLEACQTGISLGREFSKLNPHMTVVAPNVDIVNYYFGNYLDGNGKYLYFFRGKQL